MLDDEAAIQREDETAGLVEEDQPGHVEDDHHRGTGSTERGGDALGGCSELKATAGGEQRGEQDAAPGKRQHQGAALQAVIAGRPVFVHCASFTGLRSQDFVHR